MKRLNKGLIQGMMAFENTKAIILNQLQFFSLFLLLLIIAGVGTTSASPYEDIKPNTWIEIKPEYVSPTSGGRHIAVGWNNLTYDTASKQVLIYDRWLDMVRGNTVNANAVMGLDLALNKIRVLKLSNWKKQIRPKGGYQTVQILPQNIKDPTPIDRHPYGCFTFVPWNQSVYLTYGATHGGPRSFHDTWRFDLANQQWLKIKSDKNPPFGVNRDYENSTVYDPLTESIIYSVHGQETWLLDTRTEQWRRATPKTEPGHRRLYSMGYDKKRHLVMLMGGRTGGKPRIERQDLWAYHPKKNKWQQKRNAPEPSSESTAMAYSSRHDLFMVQIKTATYLYHPEQDSWHLLTKTQGDAAPVHKALTYDAANDLFVMMGKHGYTTPRWWVLRLDTGKKVQSNSLKGEDIHIPITIQEALPANLKQKGYRVIQGLDRTQEAVRFGLPLPKDSGISSVGQLMLSQSTDFQFRALDHWENGNIRWVLVDTLADVGAGTANKTYALMKGSALIKQPMASEDDHSITIDTGAAKFVLRKKAFNYLDQVIIKGKHMIDPGKSPGIILQDTSGTQYRASADLNADVSIEENGPVRTVVRVIGSHVSSGGQKLADFTLRSHFVKGKTSIRSFYTLRNASRSQIRNLVFDSLGITLSTGIQEGEYKINSHIKEINGRIGTGEKIELFQGKNGFPYIGDYNFQGEPNRQPTGISGYLIQKGDTILKKGAPDQWIDLFYAAFSNGERSLMAGTRFAAGWWPQGISFTADGLMTIGVFPAGNDRPYALKFNGHLTREFFIDFSPANARNQFFAFQYPLVGKASDPNWYNAAGGIWERIVPMDQEAHFAQKKKWDSRYVKKMKPELRTYRHKYWGQGGAANQYDYTKINMHNFLRCNDDRAGGYYLSAEQRLIYNADLACHHTDDYDHSIAYKTIPELRGKYGHLKSFITLSGKEKLPTAKVIFEGEHRHAYGLPLWYYLSGDERFKDTYQDWGEYMLTQKKWNRWERGLFWNIYNLVDLYRFTGQDRYKQMAWSFFKEEFIDKRASHISTGAPSSGMDWKRGFYVSSNVSKNNQRSMAAFIKGAMLPRTLAYLYEYGHGNPEQKDQVLDVLEATVRFVADELWFEYGSQPGQYGFAYRISADEAPPENVKKQHTWYGGYREAFLTFVFGYILTDEQDFLKKGKMLLKLGAENLMGVIAFQEWPDSQTLLHLIENQEGTPTWQKLHVESESLGNGQYKVSFKVPEKALAYRLKYSNKTIVETLGFDRNSRQFSRSPELHVPFFAASNVIDEPPMLPHGSIQSVIVNTGILQSARFSARVLIGTGNNRAYLN